MRPPNEYMSLRDELVDLHRYCRHLYYIAGVVVLSALYFSTKFFVDKLPLSCDNISIVTKLLVATTVFSLIVLFVSIFLYRQNVIAIFRAGNYLALFHDLPGSDGIEYGWHFWNRLEKWAKKHKKENLKDTNCQSSGLRLVYEGLFNFMALITYVLILAIACFPLFLPALSGHESEPSFFLFDNLKLWSVILPLFFIILVIGYIVISVIISSIDTAASRSFRIWIKIRKEPQWWVKEYKTHAGIDF